MFQGSSSEEEEALSDTDRASPSLSSPAPLFTELLELMEYSDGAREWKEVARWVKYEETVEEAGNRSARGLYIYLISYIKSVIDGASLMCRHRNFREFSS